MGIFKDEKIWRDLTNLWSLFFIAFLLWNFFALDAYEYLIAPFSVVYTAILSLYAGTKEFDRWYDNHDERHPGEWFVLIWTVVIGALIVASFNLGSAYKVSSEAVAVYIMVLSIFALTQKSKRLYEEKKRMTAKKR